MKNFFEILAPTFKAFETFRDRKGNTVTETVVVDSPAKADVAVIYSKLPADYTKAADNVKDAIKVKFLELASKHYDKCGRCKFTDPKSVFLGERGISIQLFAKERVVLETADFELPA